MGGQRHAPAALPRERHGTQIIGDWVGPMARLNIQTICPLCKSKKQFKMLTREEESRFITCIFEHRSYLE